MCVSFRDTDISQCSHAAIDDVFRTGDEGGLIRSQEDDQVGHLGGIGHAAQRNLFQGFAAALVGGGLGGVREARAGLSGVTAPQRERFSSIRT